MRSLTTCLFEHKHFFSYAKDVPASWYVNIQGAEVAEAGPQSFSISLKRKAKNADADGETGRMLLYAKTELECTSWITALRYASQRRLSNHYKVGAVIGEGGFAKVRIGRCMKSGELRAIKTMKKDENYAKLFGREIAIIKKVEHPNIVKTYDVFETNTEIHIVMEYMQGGMLYDAIEDRVVFEEGDVVMFMCELLDGLIYLHESGIVHRDLKPENILCTSQKFPLHVKIADFGLSSITSVADLKADRVLMSTMIGTPEFVAPEIARQEKYTEKVDIWALGMLLYNVIAGRLPLDETRDMISQLQSGINLTFPERQWRDYSPEAKSFIRSLLCEQPEKRLTPLACMCHSWIEKNKQNKSSLVGAHGRVSRLMLFGDQEILTGKANTPAAKRNKRRAQPAKGRAKRLWKRAFLAVNAYNRLTWLVWPRQIREKHIASVKKSGETTYNSGYNDSTGDFTTNEFSVEDFEKGGSCGPGFEGSYSEETDVASPAQSTLLKNSGMIDRVKRISQPTSLKVKKFRSSMGRSKKRASYDSNQPNSAPAGTLSISGDGPPPRKPTLKEKAKCMVEEKGPLRKISRRIKAMHDGNSRSKRGANGEEGGGILGPLKKMSRKITSKVGGKGKSNGSEKAEEDLDDALGGLGLDIADVDDGDLLLLEDAELSGPASQTFKPRDSLNKNKNKGFSSPVSPAPKCLKNGSQNKKAANL